MTSELLQINSYKKNTLIICFGGMVLKMGGILPFEFLNFLSKIDCESDKIFYIDKKQSWYHNGIENISSTIDETVLYLKNKINGYKKVIFMGVSAGGYAAILFGSLLNVQYVISFIPRTNLTCIPKATDIKYINLKNHINSVTQYILYGDPNIKNINDNHHISHCLNLVCKNVELIQIENLCMKKLCNDGTIEKLLHKIFNTQLILPP